MKDTPEARRPSWLRAIAGIAFLHGLTALPYPWEGTAVTTALSRPSADLGLLLALLAVLGLGVGARALAVHAAALAALAVPLYRFGETAMPVFYAKPFESWVDLRLLPALLHLVGHDRPAAVQWAMAAGAVAAAAAVYVGAALACRAALRACAGRWPALGLLAVLQLAVLAGALADNRAPPCAIWQPSMARAALGSGLRFLREAEWRYRERFELAAAATAGRLAATPQDCAVLAGTDVYVLFLESYGRALLQGEGWPRYAGWLEGFAAELAAGGLSARSAWAEPSVHGGHSTHAHLELLSGVPVPDQRWMDLLLASEAHMLPALLRARGYHTVNVQPAMPRDWPEAKVMGFARDVFQPAFDYAGHVYPWGRMPDQFALQRVLADVVRPGPRPLFLQYVSVTSHAPFREVPPYFDDWAQAGARDAFARPPARSFPIDWASYTGHPDLAEAYLACIHYSLRCAFGFLLRAERPLLAFVLGDHQPPLPPEIAADRSRHVPIHAISNRPELLPPLADLGFVEGLLPPERGSAFPTARFLPAFLRAYSGKEGR